MRRDRDRTMQQLECKRVNITVHNCSCRSKNICSYNRHVQTGNPNGGFALRADGNVK
jgi:hypothetical protein